MPQQIDSTKVLAKVRYLAHLQKEYFFTTYALIHLHWLIYPSEHWSVGR